jgi:hypothetical protein
MFLFLALKKFGGSQNGMKLHHESCERKAKPPQYFKLDKLVDLLFIILQHLMMTLPTIGV